MIFLNAGKSFVRHDTHAQLLLQKNRFATYVKSLSDAKTQLGTYLLKHPEALGDQEKTAEILSQAEVSDADKAKALAELLSGDTLTTQLLEDAGIKCIYLELSKADQVTNEMTSLGKIFGEEEQAQKYVDFCNKYNSLIDERLKNIKEEDRVKVYYEGYTDYKSANSTTGGHQLVTSAGGINIAADESTEYPEISDEWVLEQNPQAVVKLVSNTKNILGPNVTDSAAAEEVYNNLISRPGWSELQAVKDGKVIIVEAIGESVQMLISQAFMMQEPDDARAEKNETFLKLYQWHELFQKVGFAVEKSLPTIDSELCVYNQKVFVLSCQLEDKYSGSK